MLHLEKTQEFQEVKSFARDMNEEVAFYPVNGFSYENDYIPLYSAFVNRGIYSRKIIHYSIPFPRFDQPLSDFRRQSVNNHTFRRYNDLFSGLKRGTLPKIFQTSSMEVPLYFMKGLMYELVQGIPKIHFCVSVKTKYMFNMDRDNLDKSKFALFITPEFINSDKFRNVYLRFNRDILENMQQTGVDTIITNDIEKWCYNNDLEVPQFSTIGEMKGYLRTFNSTIFNEQREESS